MGNHEVASPALPYQGGLNIMKLRTAKNINLAEGRSDDILFGERLIACGLFKWGMILPSGFGLRLRRASRGRILRHWVFQYRQHGRTRRMIIGSADTVTLAQALEKARKLHAEVELGGDPQAKKVERREKDSLSLRSVVSDYLAQKTGVKEGTLRMLRTYLEGPLYLRPLHGVPLDQISRKDIAARLLAVSRASGAPTAIAFRSALSSLFVWAMQMGLTEHNPVVNSFKPPTPDSRDRVLRDPELAAIWNALEDDDYAKVIKLLVCTGCRRSEVGGMKWTEFSDDMSTWSLPKERAKNAKEHKLPVPPLMSEIIKSIPRRDGFDLLFGWKHGFTGWSIGKRALDKKLGLKPWTHHDIRRSVATGLANIGVQPHVVEQILNHQSGHKRGPAGIYNRSVYTNEVRAALALWSDHLRTLVEGGERKIVPMQRGA
jgi:integrase